MWMNVASEKQRGSDEWTDGVNGRTASIGNGGKCKRVDVEAMVLISSSLTRRWV